jgi:hypothetical protein
MKAEYVALLIAVTVFCGIGVVHAEKSGAKSGATAIPSTTTPVLTESGGRKPTTASLTPSLEQRVLALEAENAALKQILQRSGDDLVISAKGRLKITTGTDLEVKAGSAMKLMAAGNGVVRSAGPLNMDGSVVTLNGGTKPVASMGGKVTSRTGTAGVVGQIADGSSTVLVP